MIENLSTTLDILTSPGPIGLLDCDALLIATLRCVNQIIVGIPRQVTMGFKFSLSEACELILQSPQLSGAARRLIRNIRIDLSKSWLKRCSTRYVRCFVTNGSPGIRLNLAVPLPNRGWYSDVEPFQRYIAKIRTTHAVESGHHERIDTLWALGPSPRQVFSSHSINWSSDTEAQRFELVKTFNKFVQDVDQTSHQIEVRTLLHDPRVV